MVIGNNRPMAKAIARPNTHNLTATCVLLRKILDIAVLTAHHYGLLLREKIVSNQTSLWRLI
ncbi:hypothetical protein DERP_009612 [Dermatophagoides pteronyssinus]|uniref:Uncharacterized protein n=1 Tax=Dermatophagoides pteronyssinus TaxID=6956 RepID=A0ABQ8JAD5_DERPT|nr:hypothetical protein DERP_009612 [Dermatophagoides pteronyssinus]